MMQQVRLKDSTHQKIVFEALETQFGVKKAKFGGLRAKLDHLRSIKAGELT